MKELTRVETISLIGGTPSGRRCDRLARRALRGSKRAADTFDRICDGIGSYH
jgi:hypothetical protein